MSTHSSIRVRAFIVAVALCTLFGMRAEAQALKATILGRITDSSGGAMPNAKVTVRNVDTGLNQSVTTDAQGRYNIPDLDIGNYEAAAEMSGFKKITHQNVVLSVGSQIVIDFSMEVGATTQSVVVEGEVTQVDTTSSSVGTLVEPTQLRDLPLNGRNFTQLMLLAPGVQQSYLQGSAFSERGYGYSISGSKVFGQEFLIDNTDAVDFFGHGMGSGGYRQFFRRRLACGISAADEHVQRTVRRQWRCSQRCQQGRHERTSRFRVRISAQQRYPNPQLLRPCPKTAVSQKSIRLQPGRSDQEEQGILFRKLRGAAAVPWGEHPDPHSGPGCPSGLFAQ
jgi:hypothetical protein